MPNLKLFEIDELIAEEEGLLTERELIRKTRREMKKHKGGHKGSTIDKLDETHAEDVGGPR